MLWNSVILVLTTVAAGVQAYAMSPVRRQDDCSVFGVYPPYTGPCETTNCGAGRINCLKQVPAFQYCVGFPAIGCPFIGCGCSLTPA